MSQPNTGALTAEEWENRALWRPGSDAEFDSGALWASEVLPADFPALIALVNAEAGIVTWAMVDRMNEAAARLAGSGGQAESGVGAELAASLLADAVALAALLPPRGS